MEPVSLKSNMLAALWLVEVFAVKFFYMYQKNPNDFVLLRGRIAGFWVKRARDKEMKRSYRATQKSIQKMNSRGSVELEDWDDPEMGETNSRDISRESQATVEFGEPDT